MTQEIRDAVARAIKATKCAKGHSFALTSDAPDLMATAALTALSACEPTPEMVEAGADVMLDERLERRIGQIQGFVNYPRDDRHWIRDLTLRPGDQVIWDGGASHEEMMAELTRIRARILARAAVSAALKMVGK